jgi:hypothetical protein
MTTHSTTFVNGTTVTDAGWFNDLDRQTYEDVINVKNYGALGDGVTDDTSAITTAIAAAVSATTPTVLYFPTGTYLTSSTLTLSNNFHVMGEGYVGLTGTRFTPSGNFPVFTVAAKGTLENFVIIGTNNAGHTAQDGIYMTGQNNVTITRVSFTKCYNSIHLKNVCFYIQIDHCEFYDNINAHLLTDGTGANGVDFKMYNSQCVPSAGKYFFYFTNLGSAVVDNLVISPATMTENSLYWDTCATNYGASVFSNVVFEGSVKESVKLVGTLAAPVKFVYFNQCNFNQSSGSLDAINFNYTNEVSIINSYISGFVNGLGFNQTSFRTRLIGNTFATVGDAVHGYAGSTITGLDMISNSLATGTANYLDLSAVTAANITSVNILGGYGGGGTPITIPAAANAALTTHQTGVLSLKGPAITGSTFSMGDLTSSATATPLVADMGGTFSSSAGANPKLKIYNDGTNVYGLGVATGGFFEFQMPGTSTYKFYSGGTSRLVINASGRVNMGTSQGDDTVNTLQVDGSIALKTAGSGLKVKEGSNARMGNSTLVGGQVIVANTSIAANTRIFTSRSVLGGAAGHLSCTRVNGTSFTINSSSGTDTSTIDWFLMDPAP